jgi:transcriptional regulator GlxA family with amidase domain
MRLALAPFLITALFCTSLAEVRISTMSTLNDNNQQALQVGFLLYDGYELLDAAGPMEMFAALANSINEDPAWAKKQKPVKVFTVSERQEVKSENIFTVKADYTFEDAPHIDLLVLPGGIGARAEIKNEKFMSFLKKRATDATTVLTYAMHALCVTHFFVHNAACRNPMKHVSQ